MNNEQGLGFVLVLSLTLRIAGIEARFPRLCNAEIFKRCLVPSGCDLSRLKHNLNGSDSILIAKQGV